MICKKDFKLIMYNVNIVEENLMKKLLKSIFHFVLTKQKLMSIKKEQIKKFHIKSENSCFNRFNHIPNL